MQANLQADKDTSLAGGESEGFNEWTARANRAAREWLPRGEWSRYTVPALVQETWLTMSYDKAFM